MSSKEKEMKQLLGYLNTVSGGNLHDTIKHLDKINSIMSSNSRNKVSEIANTSLNFLHSKPNGEGKENIKIMCEMNKTVMPYIVQHYRQTGKNEENTVVVYNEKNKEMSFWYNFFYGIIISIENALKTNLNRQSLQEIQSNIESLCENKKESKGGKLMIGGMNIQLFGALIFGISSIATAYLPSEIKFVPNKYQGMEMTTGEKVIDYASKVVIPTAGAVGFVGAEILGDHKMAMDIADVTLKAEAGAVIGDFGRAWLGFTDDEKREKFGIIANLAATDLRNYADSAKDMVLPEILLTEHLNNQIITKTIMVGQRVIEPQSSEGKAIQNTFRFLNGQYEVKVFSQEFPKFVTAWKEFSSQSSNPTRDNKGILMGNIVSYQDISSKGIKLTNQVEANYAEVAQKAGLDVNDIQNLSNIMNEFSDLYFSNQITISEDTLKLMVKLNDAIESNNEGILGMFKDDGLANKNKKAWNEFKDSMDSTELNVYPNWAIWFMRHAIKFGLGTVLIYAYINSKSTRTWMEWFKSWVVSSKKTGGKRKTKSKKSKVRKTKKNHKRRNKKRVK